MKYDFTILGGDKRTSCIAPILATKGFQIACFHTVPVALPTAPAICHVSSLKEALESTCVIITGIPFARNDHLFCEEDTTPIHISELQRYLRKHHTVFGGVIPKSFRQTCEERGINCYDFMSDEPLSLANAVSTAEGAILEALIHKDTTLHKSRTLVLGYGRCGKILADKLKGLNARVTVCSQHDKELSLAAALGFHTMPLLQLDTCMKRYEYIFNTIPACILTRACLSKLSENSIIIDIASNRSGADYEAAKELNTAIYYCPGLPGKYAPHTSARYLTRYVLQNCGFDTTQTK